MPEFFKIFLNSLCNLSPGITRGIPGGQVILTWAEILPSALSMSTLSFGANSACRSPITRWEGTIGKGAKERILYIANPDSFHMLESYTSQYQRVGTTYIFNNRRNRRLSEQSIRNMVNTYAIEAGIQQHITPHMFRHTFATSLLEAGVDIRYIQQMLGHSSILTTQIYTYTSTAKIRSILESSHPRNSFVLK